MSLTRLPAEIRPVLENGTPSVMVTCSADGTPNTTVISQVYVRRRDARRALVSVLQQDHTECPREPSSLRVRLRYRGRCPLGAAARIRTLRDRRACLRCDGHADRSDRLDDRDGRHLQAPGRRRLPGALGGAIAASEMDCLRRVTPGSSIGRLNAFGDAAGFTRRGGDWAGCDAESGFNQQVAELARKTAEIQILQRVSAQFNSTLDLDEICDVDSERWASCSSSTTLTILLLEPDNRPLSHRQPGVRKPGPRRRSWFVRCRRHGGAEAPDHARQQPGATAGVCGGTAARDGKSRPARAASGGEPRSRTSERGEPDRHSVAHPGRSIGVFSSRAPCRARSASTNATSCRSSPTRLRARSATRGNEQRRPAADALQEANASSRPALRSGPRRSSANCVSRRRSSTRRAVAWRGPCSAEAPQCSDCARPSPVRPEWRSPPSDRGGGSGKEAVARAVHDASGCSGRVHLRQLRGGEHAVSTRRRCDDVTRRGEVSHCRQI